MAVNRRETIRLDATRRTPQGGLVAPAFLTRSGVFDYQRSDGSTVREYRPPDEVFKADSLATLASAPVTNLHPSQLVKSDNFKQFSVGHVGEQVSQDGDKVAATLYVQDASTVAAIEGGLMRQVSCGYTCDIADESGITPAGERYDRVQRNISYNHVAIVPVGRAGAEVALRLDAADNQITEDKQMNVERIDGVDFEIGTEQHKAAIKLRDQVAGLNSALDKAQGRADSAEEQIKVLSAENAALKDPARIDAAVSARAALLEMARKLSPEVKADGLSDHEIRVAALNAARPELKLDGKSAEYVAAAFDVATASPNQPRIDAVATKNSLDPVENAQRALAEHTANAWQKARS